MNRKNLIGYYRQCKLERWNKDGSKSVDTAWIPASFGEIGLTLRIKNKDGDWEDGWVVVFVGDQKVKDYVEQHERDYRYQRRASDI